MARVVVGARINSHLVGVGAQPHQGHGGPIVIGLPEVADRLVEIRPYAADALLVCRSDGHGIRLEGGLDLVKHRRPVIDLAQLKPGAHPEFAQPADNLAVEIHGRVLLHQPVGLGEILLDRHRHALLHGVHLLRRVVGALRRHVSRVAVGRKRIDLHGVLDQLHLLIVALALVQHACDAPSHRRWHLDKRGSRRHVHPLPLQGEHVGAAFGDELRRVGPCVEHLHVAEPVFHVGEFEHDGLVGHVEP